MKHQTLKEISEALRLEEEQRKASQPSLLSNGVEDNICPEQGDCEDGCERNEKAH